MENKTSFRKASKRAALEKNNDGKDRRREEGAAPSDPSTPDVWRRVMLRLKHDRFVPVQHNAVFHQ